MRFQILEHTADIGLRVEAESLKDLFAAAALGLQSIALGTDHVFEPAAICQMSAVGEDLESLLVNWLNEVIYHLDARRFAASRIEIGEMNEHRVTADVWGESFAATRLHSGLVVKAATYHKLKVSVEDGHWIAEVYFDI